MTIQYYSCSELRYNCIIFAVLLKVNSIQPIMTFNNNNVAVFNP